MNIDDPHKIIENECAKAGIDPKLMRAIISVESSWNLSAIRYEPDFHFTTEAERMAVLCQITEDVEIMLQKCSFGLGQIMGATARFLGYKGKLNCLLTDATLGTHWCVEYLKYLCKRYPGEMKDQISAYNAGTAYKNPNGTYKNQSYVDKVMHAYSLL